MVLYWIRRIPRTMLAMLSLWLLQNKLKCSLKGEQILPTHNRIVCDYLDVLCEDANRGECHIYMVVKLIAPTRTLKLHFNSHLRHHMKSPR